MVNAFFFRSLTNFQVESNSLFFLLLNNSIVEAGISAKFSEILESTKIVFSEILESTRIAAIESFKQLMMQLVTQVRAFKMHVSFYTVPLK